MTDYETLLREHTTLVCRSIDHIFLQGYLPKLQSVGQVCNFLRYQRGFRTETVICDIRDFGVGRRVDSSCAARAPTPTT